MRKAGILVVSLLLALTPATLMAHGGTEVTVSGEVRPNALTQIKGEEFEPNDDVRIELRKEGVEPIVLGWVTADADGNFSVSLHVPARVQPGLYQLAAEGEASATTDVTVLQPLGEGEQPAPEPSETVSNDRPADETVGLAVLTAVLALAGTGLLWASRTRIHPTRP